jgi:hypothetical protein
VQPPDVRHVGQDEVVEHGAGGPEHADDRERIVDVRERGLVTRTVVDRERPADAHPRTLRHLRADHRLQRGRPQLAVAQAPLVVPHVIVRRADDAKTAVIVLDDERHRELHFRTRRDLLRLTPGERPRRHVELVDAREDDLERAAFRADGEIDAARVDVHPLLELGGGQHEQRDRRDAEREQHDVEQRREVARAQIRETDRRERHGGGPSTNWFLKRARMR